jgi:hypothetical protein
MEQAVYDELSRSTSDLTQLAQQIDRICEPAHRPGRAAQLARFLLNSEDPFPDLPLYDDYDKETYRNFETLRSVIDWDSFTVRDHARDPLILSPADESFLAKVNPIQGWGSPLVLTMIALARVKPREKAAVVVTMRDEGISILQWVAHYRALGFRGIFVYTNDNGDNSLPLLRRLSEIGAIVLICNEVDPKVSPQRKAYEHSLALLPELRDFEWVLYADSDEFLILKNDSDIGDVIVRISERYPDHAPAAVCYGWKMFQSAFAFERTPGFLLERFKYSVPSNLVKSMVRSNSVVSMRRIHFPDVGQDDFFIDSSLRKIEESCDRTGIKDKMWGAAIPCYDGGQINHYWVKSFQEFAIK